MNFEFNVAVHLLTFLAKHDDEQFSSKQLATLVCVNPVQLRRVSKPLLEKQFITSTQGQRGGYKANEKTKKVKLSELFQLFQSTKSTRRLYTGNQSSECLIASRVSKVMEKNAQHECEVLTNYYEKFTIEETLHSILEEEKNE